jgi:hypothetical protein
MPSGNMVACAPLCRAVRLNARGVDAGRAHRIIRIQGYLYTLATPRPRDQQVPSALV